MVKRNIEGEQYGFDATVFPHPLERFGIQPDIINLLQKDRKWSELEGVAAIVNIEANNSIIVNPQTLAPKELYNFDTTLPHKRNLSGVAVLMPSVKDELSTIKMINSYLPRLAFGGIFRGIEPFTNTSHNFHRFLMLEQSGYVESEVKKDGGYIVWRARKVQYHARKEINLFESKSAGYAHSLISAVGRTYRESGFLGVVGISAAIIHTKNQYMTLQSLKEGNGFRVQGPCGCIVERSTRGDWGDPEEPYNCNGGHQGLWEAERKFDLLTTKKYLSSDKPILQVEIHHDVPPREVVLGSHGACGGTLKEISVQKGRKRRGKKVYTRFEVHQECTSCGDQYNDRIIDVQV